MKLQYSPKAKEDLHNIKQYISDELQNKKAALHITQSILCSCSLLKSQPFLGLQLSQLINRETSIRYLISGKYIIFYIVENEYISVLRFLDSRTYYMQKIFELLDD